MSLNIISEGQRTEEWFAVRIGCLTASRIGDAIAVRKRGSGGDLQCRADLKIELAVERITNKPTEHTVTPAMLRGTELEPLARAAYELRTGVDVEEIGFVVHDSIKWAGCSPDGLVGTDGLVELKVPRSTTHANYLLGEVVPEQYIPQMTWQMACTGRQWVDFASWCPDFPEPLDLFVRRLHRDEQKITEMQAEAKIFLLDVEALELRLRGGLEAALRRSLEVSSR